MPMKAIEWTDQAREDLRAVIARLRTGSTTASRRFVSQLEKKLTQIARFPASGRPVPEDPDSGVREIVVMKWRIGYQAGARINVLYVVHGRQMFPPLR